MANNGENWLNLLRQYQGRSEQYEKVLRQIAAHKRNTLEKKMAKAVLDFINTQQGKLQVVKGGDSHGKEAH